MPWLAKSDFMMPGTLDTVRLIDSALDVKPWVHWLTATDLLFLWTASPNLAIGLPPSLYGWPATLNPTNGSVTLADQSDVIVVVEALEPFEFITRIEALDSGLGGYLVFTDTDSGS